MRQKWGVASRGVLAECLYLDLKLELRLFLYIIAGGRLDEWGDKKLQ